MKKIFALITTFLFSVLGLLVPLSTAQANLVCEAGECEFVFNKTEQLETWQVPAGVTEIDFEVYGAEGGGGGGRGGFVSGTLINLPQELIVAVGGAGLRGAYSEGGYNGGGNSGGKHANPGSGGGASDIRIGTGLSDRIVVAGGGGGYGGPTGGNGGDGGGEIAADGSAGQGGAGAGGSQISGGAGGKSNSAAVDGQAGQFGLGGNGGEDPIAAGGAGGGGGYYGGGGSGADTDPCCLDAGGGGGGSSYADPTYATDVTFQPGTNIGHGKIVFRYRLPAEVTSFSYEQLARSSMEVDLKFDQPVTGVELRDFEIIGCEAAELSGAADEFKLSLGGCQQQGSVTFLANSVGDALNAPTTNTTIEFELDQSAPFISFDYPSVVSSDSFQIAVETDESGVFNSASISSSNCLFNTLLDGKIVLVDVTNCPDGEAQVEFDVDFLTDSIGNNSLEQPKQISVLVDTLAPVVESQESQVLEVELDGVVQSQSITQLTFSESLANSPDFVFVGPEQCVIDVETSSTGANLQTQGCPEGTISWKLSALALEDAAGNVGPSEDLIIELAIPVVVQPITEPAPAAEGPDVEPPLELIPLPGLDSTPKIDDSEATDEEETVEAESDETESETVETPIDAEASNSTETSTNTQTTDDTERSVTSGSVEIPITDDQVNTVTETSSQEDEETIELATPVARVESAGEEVDQVSPWAIAFASAAVIALLIAVLFLTKNNRSRTIE